MGSRWKSSLNRGRGAFTLLELLVAMSISLIMLYAVILFLRWTGDTVSDGRAMIELTSQLRAVRQRLHEDLSMITVPVRPWADNGGAQGYFMYYEGILADQDRNADGSLESDSDSNGVADVPVTVPEAVSPWGDFDDVLAFTIRTKGGEPLVGRTPNGMQQADAAEVVWYCGWDDTDGNGVPNVGEMRYLFRRQLLVNPSLVTITSADVSRQFANPASNINYPFGSKADAVQGLLNFQQNYDLSVRIESNGSGGWILVGNTLADLARRENRYAHVWNQVGNRPAEGYPTQFGLIPSSTPSLANFVLQDRVGEDVQLSRCIAFDVRVFDPTAAVIAGQVDAAGPSDRIARINPDPAVVGAANLGYGAFVDLNYSRYTIGNSYFSGPSSVGSKLNAPIYDTWSITYERDGIDQDNDGMVDEGTNGLDDAFPSSINPANPNSLPIPHDNSNMSNIRVGGADDITERETFPPYDVPLRGIQVLIRVFDPSTRQLRQATVVADFTPE